MAEEPDYKKLDEERKRKEEEARVKRVEEHKKKKEEREKDIKNILKKKNPYHGIEWLTEGQGWQINYKGTFNFEAFYKTMYLFLQGRGYGVVKPEDKPGDKGDDKYEHYYEHRGGPFTEVWYKWRAKKTRFPQHCDWYVFFNCHLLGLQSKEVMHQNEKIKVHSVELDCWLKGGIRWFNKFDEGPQAIRTILGDNGEVFYKKYFHEERETIEEEFYGELVDLHNQMKALLGLPEFNPGSRQFMYYRRGYPHLGTDAPDWSPHPDK